MRVNALDHVNIQSLDVKATARFYADVLGLSERDPPPPLDPKRVRWMFDGESRPIFHLTTPGSILGPMLGEGGRSRDTGPVHHVALDCSGHDAMVARLKSLGLAYRLNHVVAIDLKQIFVHDPAGVLIEMNYRAHNQ